MDMGRHWAELFSHWPDGLDRRGVLVTSFGEQIPFAGFQTSETLLLLDRQTPDAMGARKIILSFDTVIALKITDVVKDKALAGLGFKEPPKMKAPG